MKATAEKVGKDEVTTVEDMPSFEEVMRIGDLRIEVRSLMMMKMRKGSIHMSTVEVRCIIEAASGSLDEKELRKLPGTEEPSVFEALFED